MTSNAPEKALEPAAEKARHCAALARQTELELKQARVPAWDLVPMEFPGRANPWRLPDAWGWRFA